MINNALPPATVSELYALIAKVTTRFEFTAPVEQADLNEFYRQLRKVLPSRDVVIEVVPDADPRYVNVKVDTAVGGYVRQMIIAR